MTINIKRVGAATYTPTPHMFADFIRVSSASPLSVFSAKCIPVEYKRRQKFYTKPDYLQSATAMLDYLFSSNTWRPTPRATGTLHLKGDKYDLDFVTRYVRAYL